MPSVQHSTSTYHLIGLGFGPANLAIAGAILDKWAASPSSNTHVPPQQVLFIEKQSEFKWHPGMLLPNSLMQISFLKDLATLRSPQSPITFLAYLHSQGRLSAFINRASFTPTREEFADYLAWSAEYVQKHGIQVNYGEEVVGIHRSADGTIEISSRDLKTDQLIFRRAKNIVISPGGTPKLPPALAALWPHPRVHHSSTYISSADAFFAALPHRNAPLRIAVIGAGQSSTEVLLDLHARLNALPIGNGQKHELDMIFRKGSLKPSDDSAFSNEIFDPASTDFMFGLPTQRDRQNVLREYNPTNYSVVNVRTIDSLYEVLYQQKLRDGIQTRTGREKQSDRTRIALHPYTSVIEAEVDAGTSEARDNDGDSDGDRGGVRLTLHGLLTRAVTHKTYDAVFCGTGYDRDGWMRLLADSDLARHFGIKSPIVELVPHPDVRSDGRSSSESKSENASEKENERGSRTHPLFADLQLKGGESGGSSDGFSTPPTPDTDVDTDTYTYTYTDTDASSPVHRPQPPSRVRISRAYRLLPHREGSAAGEGEGDGEREGEEVGEQPRVYLQGCTQATHGLSESLLSILGVRAGLVVDDIWGA